MHRFAQPHEELRPQRPIHRHRRALVVNGLALAIGLGALAATSRGESATAAVEAKFRELDRKGDGVLTRDELPVGQVFSRLDANGDGKVTLEEAIAGFPSGLSGPKAKPESSTALAAPA